MCSVINAFSIVNPFADVSSPKTRESLLGSDQKMAQA
jgi:hypothetical protein